MSKKRKNRKNKIRNEQRKLRRQEEILKLEAQLKELQEEKDRRRLNNLKNLGIRNLKIFVHCCNFLAPYVVTAGLAVGGFKLFDGGLPFHKDDVIKYNRIDLNKKSEERINYNEHYAERHWYDDVLPDSSLKIQFPYQEINGCFTRVIRDYDVTATSELIAAVLDNDVNRIEELLPKYDEETETTSECHDVDDDSVIIAELHFIDKSQVLSYPESDLKNNIITATEALIVLIVGTLIAHFRKFKIIVSIKDTKELYQLESIVSIDKEINSTRDQIRILKKEVSKN